MKEIRFDRQFCVLEFYGPDSDGDLAVSIDEADRTTSFYLTREEAARLRDWIEHKFLNV